MPDWQGKREVVVVTACMTRAGFADFALTEVEVTRAAYEEGVHYDLVNERLHAAGYEEPFVHFDADDAPPFLVPAVRQHLRAPRQPRESVFRSPQENA
jgi:hypothetical protein